MKTSHPEPVKAVYYWEKSQLLRNNNPIINKFFKDLTNDRKKTNRAVVLSCRPFATSLNTGIIDKTFQQSGKQDSWKHLLKGSASMWESSGSQFFRTTAGIQSGLDAFSTTRDTTGIWSGPDEL